MTNSKRLRAFLLVCILAAFLVAFFVSVCQAFSITGGTAEQRSYAAEVINANDLPVEWIESRLGEIEITVEVHHDPYWELSDSDWEYEDTAAGLASYGRIWVAAKYSPGYETFFGEIIAHEMCHQLWFALNTNWRTNWRDACTEGVVILDAFDWYQNYCENHAENSKAAFFSPEYLKYDSPRTKLNTFTAQWVKAWHEEAMADISGPPPAPFNDLVGMDYDGYTSIVWVNNQGLFEGYPDGSFHPWDSMLKRHVALIAQRAGVGEYPAWLDDYSLATRGDVKAAFPGLAFDSERWDEPILRSQVARLLYRAGDGP